MRSKMNLIERVQVERVDRKRLFERGGVGIPESYKDSTVAIIGCGSLGSPLAMSLSKCGIAKFLLVDKENIEAENVARHLCGMREVSNNLPKAEAVKGRLLGHFPHIECELYHKDILALLKEEGSLLNAYDLIVVAVGNNGVERRLNHLLREGVLTPPLVYLWIEPFAVAGQVLFVHPTKGGCYQCCFDIDQFRYRVARRNKEFDKRESGCQTTFMPYSNLEIEHFIAVASKQILRILKTQSESSFLFTWLGDLDFFRSLGYQINDVWIADSSYTIHERIIQKNNNCVLCEED